MLEDKQWTKAFIATNSKRLKQRHDGLKAALAAINVTITPSTGTLMAWADFSQYLTDNTPEAEKALWLDLGLNAKVLFTLGDFHRSARPGFFRVCFAGADVSTGGDVTGVMEELKRRLVAKFIGNKKLIKEEHKDQTNS